MATGSTSGSERYLHCQICGGPFVGQVIVCDDSGMEEDFSPDTLREHAILLASHLQEV